jgi:hypothetical protein
VLLTMIVVVPPAPARHAGGRGAPGPKGQRGARPERGGGGWPRPSPRHLPNLAGVHKVWHTRPRVIVPVFLIVSWTWTGRVVVIPERCGTGTSGARRIIVSWMLCDCPRPGAARTARSRGACGGVRRAPGCRSAWYRRSTSRPHGSGIGRDPPSPLLRAGAPGGSGVVGRQSPPNVLIRGRQAARWCAGPRAPGLP